MDGGKRESFEVLRDAVEAIGAKAAAAHLKVSPALVYKWCEKPRDDESSTAEMGSGTRNPLDRVMGLLEATGDRGIVDWVCEQAGGFFVPNPDPADTVADKFLLETQGMIQKFSGLLSVLTESMTNDGRIDSEESKMIRQFWQELKSQVERFVIACERGQFDSFSPDGKRQPPRH